MLFCEKKVPKYLNLAMNLLIVFYSISFIYFIFFGEVYQIAPCFCSLLITLFIRLISKYLINVFSPILIFAVVIYTLFASYLGSSLDFYGLINHYDDIMHSLSGVLSTLFAYDLFIILNSNISNITLNRRLILMFVFCFSLAIGGLWEIAEFSIDSILGTNMQVGGLTDTMIDMIDSLFASILTISIYELVKRNYNK
ncbi:MAG: hypothetical protein ACRCYC_14595 [Paraclostridium sp.]|uniref:hypothetical protein n=1 Tax=Paraclostridium sp. TaxID=2023273 RepID=UPI003F32766F